MRSWTALWSRRTLLIVGMAAGLLAPDAAPAVATDAKQVKVAVAANFTEPARVIATAFEKATGNRLILSFGSTGQFFAQIKQAAPFEVFLAADKATPTKAVEEGLAVPGTQFTYALGKLVLYSTMPALATGESALKSPKFAKIAIANPATAPYGAAALEVMKALGVHDVLAGKIVQGQNIGQAYQFVASGNAEIGFVALSQIAEVDGGSRWVVPGNLHKPILQDAVLLRVGEGNPAARALLDYLKGKDAQAVIEKFGYGIGQ
jgi:molybdate transport system substrate-binding protein